MIKRRLWVAAALAPLSFAAASRVVAATSIGSDTSTPVSTSTTGNLTVTGSISVEQSTHGSNGVVTSASGPATVTVNSANSVSNSGTISAYEPTDYTDTNKDGIADTNTSGGISTAGQYAVGENRYGIDVTSATGGTSISNSGTISVVGENSAAILIGSGGLSGGLSNSGTISATGGNYGTTDVTYGIHAIGKISGAFTVTGTVSATGKNATAVALDGGAGSVVVSSSVTATGYRSTTAPTYVGYNLIIYTPQRYTKLTATEMAASKTELMQGGPAMSIGGSVTSGINITASDSVASTTVDEGYLTSYGSSPALLIGGSNALTIGAVSGNSATGNFGNVNGYSLQIGGSVSGAGTYYNFNGTAIQIGGTNNLAVSSSGVAAGSQFGTVTLNDGIDITGSVSGTAEASDIVATTTTDAVSAHADAVGLDIGSGATVSEINVDSLKTVSKGTTYYSSGSLTATVSSASTTASASAITATALKIEAGANVSSLTNSGTIAATVEGLATTNANGASTTTGGTIGTATAISDQSGSLTSIVNTRLIGAYVTPPTGTSVVSGVTTAMDLSANTTHVTVLQEANPYSTSSATITPSIIGDILFGSGAATLDLEYGVDRGAVEYGASLSNALTINGGATLTGAVTQKSGGALKITVTNGYLYDRSTSTLSSSGLTVGSKGVVVLNADPTAGTSGTIDLTSGSTATLADGAGIGLNFVSKLTTGASVDYVLVTGDAGSLTVGTINTTYDGLLPYLYKGTESVQSTATSESLVLAVTTKTTSDLGLNPAETSAYNAIYQAFSTDSGVETAMLDKTNRSSFLKLYDQFLPDYSGGAFESMVSGQQAIARAEAETPLKLQDDESRGWVEEIGVDNQRDDSAGGGHDGYNAAGVGFVAGLESAHNGQAVGVTAAFVTTSVQNSAQTKNGSYLTASLLEGGAYWRESLGGFSFDGSVNAGWAYFNSRRLIYDATDSTATEALYRQADTHWNGALASAIVQVSYQMALGRYFVRPEAEADYVALYETGHTEHGGGSAVDLAVNARTNTQASAKVDVVFGATYGTTIQWRPELTLGWRAVVNGGPANTTARFVSEGSSFTLSPDFQDKGGVLARLGLRAGGAYADFSAGAGGEFRSGYQSYDARAVARFLF